MSKCKACQIKEKGWPKGNSPIECAFENGYFKEDNWSCGSMDYIRDIAESSDNLLWYDDTYYALFRIGDYVCGVSRYKSRGRTNSFKILNSYREEVSEDNLKCMLFTLLSEKTDRTEEDNLLLNQIRNEIETEDIDLQYTKDYPLQIT